MGKSLAEPTATHNAWGSNNNKQSSDPKKDASSNLDDFSVDNAFEDKYDDDDFL